jgi:ParB-like chromosome segregation protein Spo0J
MTAQTSHNESKNSNTGKGLFPEDEIKHVPLEDILVDTDWNNRSVALTLSQAEGNESKAGGLDALKLGIFHDGQDEPVVVRETGIEGFYKKGTKFRFALVAGFRRFEAIRQLNADEAMVKVRADEKKSVVPNTANGTVRAIVRKLTEGEAVALNLRENTQRNDLSTPDLVNGAVKLAFLHQRDAKQIASTLGVSPSYAAQLLRIGSIKQEVLVHWRTVTATGAVATYRGISSAARASTTYLVDIAKADKDRQADMYLDFLKAYEEANADTEGDEGDSKKAWFKAAKKKAIALAEMFGRLAREVYGEGKEDFFLEVNQSVPWIDVVDILVKPGKSKGFEPRQKRSIADAMEKAYAASVEGTDDEEDDGESADAGAVKAAEKAKEPAKK